MRKILAVVLALSMVATVVYACGISHKKYITWDLEDNCIRQYKMSEDAANTTVVDTMGNDDGTASVNTNVLACSGKLAGGFDFDGADDYIGGMNTGAAIDSQDLTISFWMRIEGAGLGSMLGIIGDQFSDDIAGWAQMGWSIYVDTNVKLVAYTAGGVGNNYKYSNTAALSLNTWYFVTCCLSNSTSGTNEIYINGIYAVDASGSNGASAGVFSGSGNIYMGGLWDISDGAVKNYFFDGKIDNLCIYDKELSEREIKGIYNNGRGTENNKGYYVGSGK